MDFPSKNMRFVSNHAGRVTESGWLELDLRGLDLEGVGRLYLDLAEVDRLRAAGDQRSDQVERLRSLLGGEE